MIAIIYNNHNQNRTRSTSNKAPKRRSLCLVNPLAISPSDIFTVVNNEILGSVVLTTREVALEDVLGALGVTGLGVNRSTGHVRDHSIATTPWVQGVAERVILGSGLGEPDVTTVAAEVAVLEGFGNIFLDDNSTTSSVDEPRAYMKKKLATISQTYKK